MVKKVLGVIVLISFTIAAVQEKELDNPSQKAEDATLISNDTPAQEETIMVRRKDLERFYNILVENVARIYALRVSRDATIGGTLTTTGLLTAEGNLAVSKSGTFGESVTIGGCALTCSGGNLLVNGQSIIQPTPTLAYGYVFRNTAETVLENNPITFTGSGPSSGITPGGSFVTVLAAGTYAVTFFASCNTQNQFTLFINNSPAIGGMYASTTSEGLPVTTTGQVIVQLQAGDQLKLVNTSPENISIETWSLDNPVVASLLIKQLA